MDIQTCSAIPHATFGGVCWPIEAEVSACETVVQSLGGLGHALRDGPQHCLHHGQVLHVFMCLEQSITCKQQWASGTALLCCLVHSPAMQCVCFLMLHAVLFYPML